MSIDDLNPFIFTVSLVCGYFLWIILRMIGQPSRSANNNVMGNKLLTWWKSRKINDWKNANKTIENCSEQLDNRRFKMFGCSPDGTALYIEIYSFEEQCEAYFSLKLKNGTLLQHPITAVAKKSHKDSLTVGNLTIQQIVPYSKWRITFNGLLNYSDQQELTKDASEDAVQHVIFTFFWTAASDTLRWPDDWNSNLLGNAFGHLNIDSHLRDLLTTDEGFDQFGSLFGQVTINKNEKLELNLPGMRMIRNVKENQTTVYHSSKFWTIIGVCKDGFVFSLSVKEIENESTIYSGCIRKPNMNIYPLEKTNLNFDGEDRSDLSFTLVGNNETFHTKISFSNTKQTIHSFEALKTQQMFNLDVNGEPGLGTLISYTRTSNNRNLKPLNSMIQTSLEPVDIRTIKDYTLRFCDAEAQLEELSGGKGASLAYLTKLSDSNFIVPNGFILTTNSFKYHVKKHRVLQEALEHLEKVAYHSVDGTLESASETVRKIFGDVSLEKEIVDSVKKEYEELRNNSVGQLKLAVRSSAVGEDSMESSSAGQNETFLGVVGFDELLIAIQKCWASLFTVQSVTYRVQNIQPIRTEMSVVIQSMVLSDCAGVLFTNHPVNNDPSKLLITANYGLGESVVSGSVDPDVFIIQRVPQNNNLKILEKNLGSKAHRIEMTSDDKVANSVINEADRQQFCLSDEEILKLCEIGISLQESYESPRDIEWAIHKNKIYLLQSRPMTSQNVFSSWELLHEFDSAVMSDEDFFTFGNVGEVMPQTMTPLTTSTLMASFERGLLRNFPVIIEAKYYNQLMAVSHHRLAMNVFSVFLRLVKSEVSIENRVHGLAIFGHEFITNEVHELAKHRFGIASKAMEMSQIWKVIKCAWVGKNTVKGLETFMEDFLGTYSRRNLKRFPSLSDLHNDITKRLDEEFPYVQSVHGITSMLTACYQIIMFSTLAEGRKDMSTEYMTDIAILLSSCKDAESAEIPVLLEEIAKTIVKCNATKATEFTNIDPYIGVEWLKNNCIVAYTLFEAFIEKNSHRGFQEFDFGYETWGMNPALVIEMLQTSIRSSLTYAKECREKQTKRSNEEILADLKTPTRSATRRVLRYFLPRCQAYVQLRERTKSMLIAYINELRKAFYYLGECMQMQGYLPEYTLIFFLTHREIGEILLEKSRNAHLINKAIRRRRLFPEWKKIRFDEFQWGVIKPKIEIPLKVDESDVKVVGTPVCEGIVTGRACVVKSFSEVSKIKSGDILVAYSTDIAWSPYFPILGGVVTELGGLISHGAVVAREYGLPCIVGATNATAVILDGQQIQMNGNTGIIVSINGKKV